MKVRMWGGVGVPLADIATLLHISVQTLQKHYAEDLISGMAKANMEVCGALFRNAVGGNVGAQIWWEKTRMGRSEHIEVTGKDARPIEYRDVGSLTDDQLVAIIDAGRRGEGAAEEAPSPQALN